MRGRIAAKGSSLTFDSRYCRATPVPGVDSLSRPRRSRRRLRAGPNPGRRRRASRTPPASRATHRASAFCRFVERSAASIVGRTLDSGVVVPGVTSDVAWMISQPLCVRTGAEIAFVFSEKATRSNAGSVWPCVMPPARTPPDAAVVASIE